jgi:hypothetical protein
VGHGVLSEGEAEPDAALSDPEAVERVTRALAKPKEAILAKRGRPRECHTDDRQYGGLEARRTASMMVALEDGAKDAPSDTIN